MPSKKKLEDKVSQLEDLPSSEKVHLHTTIDQHTYTILKQLSLQYGNISRALEQAIMLLAIKPLNKEEENPCANLIKPVDLDEYQLANVMRSKYGMISVGRRTFLSYIDNMPDKPTKDNIARELIEWFTGKEIHDLKLEAILNAIARLWKAANYFRSVTIEQILVEHGQKFKMSFFHAFNSTKYGDYWSRYFQNLFESLSCKVDCGSRDESFYLFIFKPLP